MKTMRVTISGDGIHAVCTLKYRHTDSPAEAVWSGDRRAFSYKGMMIDFAFPLSSLESAVSHQAALCGATYKIEDLGAARRKCGKTTSSSEP